jgi:iron complex transport system ATP-binding protein
MIRASNIKIAYERHVVVTEFDLEIRRGEIVTLIGPNGSGKSTVLKAMARLLATKEGVVYLNGRDIHRLPTKEVARQLCILPQNPGAPADLTVRELTAYGRSPHQPWYLHDDAQSRQAVDWALEQAGAADLAGRRLQQLSGGERQRAWIAMALAQQPQILLLDEPTTFLDISHQLEVMELLQRLNRELRITVLMVLHDLNQALRYSDRLVLIRKGRKVAEGVPEKVITKELLRDVYRVDAEIIHHQVSGKPIVLPLGLVAASTL